MKHLYLAHLATQTAQGNLENAALITENGKISKICLETELSADDRANTQHHDHRGQWLLPGFIDCHTHIVYAGNRSNEFEARLNGSSYADIAAQGGGIMATVRAVRQASEDELYQQTLPRLKHLQQEGITTLEIKSGYGLTLADERKMLRVARRIGKEHPLTVRTSYLAAHAVPPEYHNRADDYLTAAIDWMRELHREKLIDAVDAFCEHLAFSREQTEHLFQAATALGLPVKIHAEQLSNQEGAALVAEYHGLSADHIEHLSANSIAKMAANGTIGVLLPGAYYTLRDTHTPPIAAMRKAGVNMALATDCNPGTSPLTSLLLTLNMGCTLFNLTPAEAIAGSTKHAATALGLGERKGQLAIGYDADFNIWHIDRPADLCYQFGFIPAHTTVIAGEPITP